jgi:hypothetical protein
MSYFLTRFIFPIEKPIILSNSLNIIFDNPRNEFEIQAVKNLIYNSLQIGYEQTDLSNRELFLKLNFGISEIIGQIGKYDKYAFEYYKKNDTKGSIDLLSETWIIVRYENAEFEQVAKSNEKIIDLVFKIDKKKFRNEFDKIINYLSILSLCIQKQDEYSGESINLSIYPEDIFFNIERYKLVRAIEKFKHFCFIPIEEHERSYENWLFFPSIKEKLIEFSKKIDNLCLFENKNENKGNLKNTTTLDKLLFIGNLLNSANQQTENIKIRLLLLVSVIEFILTHNPDNNKFNVEESISKQFKLKTAFLIYQNNKSINLDHVKENLKKIYNLRSDIAHGNFSKWQEEDYQKTVIILYQYITAIVLEFINDHKIVDYIKEN